jgi:hypothetical protein
LYYIVLSPIRGTGSLRTIDTHNALVMVNARKPHWTTEFSVPQGGHRRPGNA